MAELTRNKLHEQLTTILRDAINTKVYSPGSYLPSEATMARQYSVSRPTIRQAISTLRSEGLVEVEMGRGTRVLPGFGYSPAVTIDRRAKTRPATPTGTGSTDTRDADRLTAELLGIFPEDTVIVYQAPGIDPATEHKAVIRRTLRADATDHVPDLSASPETIADQLTGAFGKLTTAEYVYARMPSHSETTELDLSGIVPVFEIVTVTTAKRGPIMLDTVITTAEGTRLAYRR